MTRAHIADPALAAKLARGDEARVRPCVGATHCMSEMRPTCLHNPSTGHERELPHEVERAAEKRRVLVAGGGPGGLEAARVCAERGHEVRLVEASRALGGQVLLAVQAHWRRDLIGVVDWRVGELEALGVEVQLNRYLEPEEAGAEDADVVIVATGGIPDLDWIDGAEHCTSVWDVLGGTGNPAAEVVVYDGTGRHAALIAAEKLRLSGCEVAFFGLDAQLAMEMSYAEQVIWRRRSYELGIEARLDRRLERVERQGNRLRVFFRNELTDAQEVHETDQVVVEHGTLPADDLFRGLRERSSNRGIVDQRALMEGRPQPGADAGGFRLFRIGDAVSSRNIHAAVLDAYRLCRVL